MHRKRCEWCGDNEIYCRYHDEEWGQPITDDTTLFEFITLEGAQAGLNWLTILKRRDNYRRAFADFAVDRVAAFDQKDVHRLLQDSGIIRNRAKIEATINNARCFIDVQTEFASFARYIWHFVDARPIHNYWQASNEVPASTPLAERISKDMRRRGFRFFGPVICYAHMQATGMVNDHLISCYRHAQLLETMEVEI
jgi:DNA-3-methyladenine glycosylase I